ncbi:MAG: peptide chain release factor N(5)-glutamine methyltransferase [Sulfuricaulis sp.]|uniref:peptide chain release factor N(5)-glutamine methyltransferase n=1 Tax=Sulfuricaulis sp. TaxID=2003553 RepID=UPI0025E6A92D|nr:peptide chain release factor N(5)-glutamine methyltransferase [Sulfuricaulis sp.]MCR4346998.1 peptide chain release factor N(5)-glutamine methyltransferase [Sulfuricaulis sp.]
MEPAVLHPSIVTVGAALRKALHALELTSPTPRLDAEVLLMHACGLDRSGLITRNEMAMTDEQQQRMDRLLDRRKRGEPVAYITGKREFWSMELNVSPATLIPRPETELLVEKALEHIPNDAAWTIADLGTGSGAIALALAKELPRCHVIATDHSSAALEVGKSNARKFGLTNIEFREGDWFVPLASEKLDLIVSNPPYIRARDPHLSQGDVRFEPAVALVSGADGLDAIQHIARHARTVLKPGGWLLFEHGWDQVVAVGELLRQYDYSDMVYHQDLAGHARVAACRR